MICSLRAWRWLKRESKHVLLNCILCNQLLCCDWYFILCVYTNFILCRESPKVSSPLWTFHICLDIISRKNYLCCFRLQFIFFLSLPYFWSLIGNFLTEFHFLLFFLELFTKYVTVSRKLFFCNIKCIAFCNLRNKPVLRCDGYWEVKLYHKYMFSFLTLLLHSRCPRYILPNEAIILEEFHYSSFSSWITETRLLNF